MHGDTTCARMASLVLVRKQQVLVRRDAVASMQHPSCPTLTCHPPSQPSTLPSSPRPLVSQDLRPADNRRSVLLQLQELTQRHGGTLPQLDPVEDMGVTDEVLVEAAKKLQGVEALLQQNPGRRVRRRHGLGAGACDTHPQSSPPQLAFHSSSYLLHPPTLLQCTRQRRRTASSRHLLGARRC